MVSLFRQGLEKIFNPAGSRLFRTSDLRIREAEKTYGSYGSGTLVHLHHSLRKKIIKKSQNSRNHGFSYYFCLITKGSGAGSGCGSERPKNVRIRIRKTTRKDKTNLERRRVPAGEVLNWPRERARQFVSVELGANPFYPLEFTG